MPKFTKYKWRLYADSNIERQIVGHLRRSDFDVLWVEEVPELRREKDDHRFHYRKAKELERYLLTRDEGFWNDHTHRLTESPGVLILTARDLSVAKELPILLRTLMRDYNPYPEPLYLEGIKVKLGSEALLIKMLDHDTQKPTTDKWAWSDLV